MDFLDPKKRRSHKIRLLVGYILVGLAIAIATVILVYQAYGFGVDTSTGSLVENGLVFVDSKPSQADIYLNGQLKSKSGARLVMPAEQYRLEIKRAGYHDWSRTFTLEGHSIERFVYPYLVPTTLNPRTVEVYPSQPQLASQSPDRRWIIISNPAATTAAGFDLIDTTKPLEPKISFTLPVGILSNSTGNRTLEEVEWSSDNKFLLIRHDRTEGNEFIVINREDPAASFNVNQRFNVNPLKVVLRDKKIDQLYILENQDGRLRIANLNERSLSPPLLQNVIAFRPHGNDLITYVTADNVPLGSVQARIWENGATYQLYRMPVAKNYLLDAARFDGHWYYVIGSEVEQLVEIFKDPLDKLKNETLPKATPLLALRLKEAQNISFSANARFIAATSGQKVAVYDIETDRAHSYELTEPLAAYLKWMDGHRLITRSADKMLMLDYDGTNRRLLTESSLPRGGYFDRDYDRLFVISPIGASGSTALRLVDMRSPADQPK